MTIRFYTSIGSFVDYEPEVDPGFTDVLSNSVFLKDLNPIQRVDELKDGNLDPKDLPGFLHECAHHATYDSLVGGALATLWSSCLSLWTVQVGKSYPTLPARDLAVLRVAHTMLVPLIEGLALFAEHDLVTGPSPLLSRVTQHALPIFSAGRLKDLFRDNLSKGPDLGTEWSDLLSQTHSATLRLARVDEAWVERKLFLLRQPVSGRYRYLLGYLAVKGMYRTLASRYQNLRDPELFFLLIVQHFFDDMKFARILLNIPPDRYDQLEAYLDVGCDVERVSEHFQDRVDLLYAKTGEAARCALEPLLQTSGGLPLHGTAAHGEGKHGLPDDLLIAVGMRTTGMLNIVWPKLLEHRNDFRFSFQPVKISITEDGVAVVRDREGLNEIFRTRAVDDAPRGTFHGSIEAVRLRNLTDTVVCVLISEGLVAVLDCQSGEWNSPHHCIHLAEMPSAVAVEGAMHAFADRQKLVEEHDGIREMVENYEKQAADAVDSLYPQLICFKWQLERRQRMVQAIGCSGIATIFPDKEVLRRIARISLLAGVGRNLDVVAENLRISSDALRAEIGEYNRASIGAGCFELFDLSEDNLSSLI